MRPVMMVRVPKSAWADIERILDTSTDDIRKAVDAILITPPKTDVEDLAECCSILSGVDTEIIDAVASTCMNVIRLQRSTKQSPSDLLGLVAEDLVRGEFPRWTEREDQWKERQPLLGQLLQLNGTIDIMSKARELLYEYQNLFAESAVITDVRYVYDAEATQVKGGIVLNTLSLKYKEGEEIRHTLISILPSEIDTLITQLERARMKMKIAKAGLGEIPDLTPKRDV